MKLVRTFALLALTLLGTSAWAGKPEDPNWLQWRGPEREGKASST